VHQYCISCSLEYFVNGSEMKSRNGSCKLNCELAFVFMLLMGSDAFVLWMEMENALIFCMEVLKF
jgi:hypothetical protein